MHRATEMLAVRLWGTDRASKATGGSQGVGAKPAVTVALVSRETGMLKTEGGRRKLLTQW